VRRGEVSNVRLCYGYRHVPVQPRVSLLVHLCALQGHRAGIGCQKGAKYIRSKWVLCIAHLTTDTICGVRLPLVNLFCHCT
jgi:hypothetical protein